MFSSLIPFASRVAILVSIVVASASAQFNVVGNFSYSLPDGTNVLSANAEGDVQAAMASQLVQQAITTNAVHGIAELQRVDANYFSPIAALEQQLVTAQRYSQPDAAADIANKIRTVWNDPQQAKAVHQALEDLYNGNQPALTKALYSYDNRVNKSVQDAQAIPDKINAYVRSNIAGLKLLESAWKFQGAQYRPGMQCNDLISDALKNIGFMTPSYPWCTTCTPTGGWFRYGMGPAFREIYGGNDGISLRQLADESFSGKIGLPIGAVIVADGQIGKATHEGHVALYDGIAEVNSKKGPIHEIVTYDANAFKGYLVSVITSNFEQEDAAKGEEDMGTINLVFNGHQVGEHVTRLQWGSKTVVKVYKFVGNVNMPEPRIAMQNAMNQQCRENVQLATALKASVCAKGQSTQQCKIATARLTQTINGCAVLGK